MRDRTRAAIVLLVFVHALPGCGRSGSSASPLSPSPVAQPTVPAAGSGISGVVYWRTPTQRRPLEGASVTVLVQVQTGPFSGQTYPVYGISTNGSGEFHIDSAPTGAKLIAYASYPDTSNPCMASIASYQGRANFEIDLYPNSESEEWIIDATLAGPGPIVTGHATAGGVAASSGFTYFEAVYETFNAFSPIDASGRYAFCGVPVNLMFPSRVWIENGRVSCDAKGQHSFHSIQPHSPSEYFSRDYDLHECHW